MGECWRVMGTCSCKPIWKGFVNSYPEFSSLQRDISPMQQTLRCGVVGFAASLCLDKGSKAQPTWQRGSALQENAARWCWMALDLWQQLIWATWKWTNSGWHLRTFTMCHPLDIFVFQFSYKWYQSGMKAHASIVACRGWGSKTVSSRLV